MAAASSETSKTILKSEALYKVTYSLSLLK